jgi:hypothetical protein
LYIPQNVHLFHGQFLVTRSSSEKLPPSLGGRYIPTSNEYGNFVSGVSIVRV